MTQRLADAITSLYSLDTALSPVALGEAREAAIVEGLHALAEAFGKKIEFTYIHSNGDLRFVLEGADRGEGHFGIELAGYLSMVSTRTGVRACQREVLPGGNWLWINHFEAEKLLKIVGRDMLGIAPEVDGITGSQVPVPRR